MKGLILAFALAAASSAAMAKPPSPPTALFDSDAPLNITIRGP